MPIYALSEDTKTRKYRNAYTSFLARTRKCGVDPMTVDFNAHYDRNLSGHELKSLIRKLVPCSPKETEEYPEAVIGVPEREYHRLEANVARCGSQLRSCQDRVKRLSQVKVIKAVKVTPRVQIPTPIVKPRHIPKPARREPSRGKLRTCDTSSCREANKMLRLYRKLGIK